MKRMSSVLLIAVSFTFALSFEAANAAANDCDVYPVASLTADQSNSIAAACKEDGYSCVQEKTEEMLRIATMAKLHEFLSKCTDLKSDKYKKAKKELQLLEYGYDSGELPPDAVERPWLVSVLFGQQYLPDYADGASSGFDRSQSFVEIVADERWLVGEAERHWGAMVSLEGLPVARSTEGADPSNPSFDDVADTLTTSFYFISMFAEEKKEAGNGAGNGNCKWLCSNSKTLSDGSASSSAWGWGGKVGLRSREKQGGNKDSVDWFAEAGLHYRYSEYKGEPGNFLPRGFLSVGVAYWDKYEDYQASDDDSLRWRVLVRAEYRLSDRIPLHVGVKGNLGEGLDTTMVYFAFRVNSERLLQLLSGASQ